MFSEASMLISVRNGVFAFIAACSIVVLGVSANFATLFLPNIHEDFIIFSLVVSSATLIALIVISSNAQPRFDLFILFLVAVGWVSMGSWSADIIAHIECTSLKGQTTPTKTGTMPYDSYCRQMKTILAFSWTNFAITTIIFILLLILVIRVVSWGRHEAWGESWSGVPWFGQNMEGGYGGGGYGQGYQMQYPNYQYTGPIQTGPNQYTVNQVPGHSIVIGGGGQGGVPNIQQFPGTVRSG